MEDATAIPVLAYANPIGGQPANGRLQITYLENGITLTDPRKDLVMSSGTARVLGGLLLAIGLFLTVYWYPNRQSNRDYDSDHFAAAVLMSICGLLCMVFAGKSQPKVRIVRVEDGTIYKPAFRRRGIRGRLVISVGSPDLRTGQMVHSLSVRHPLWRTVILFQYLSFDEAVWAKSELETALAAPKTIS